MNTHIDVLIVDIVITTIVKTVKVNNPAHDTPKNNRYNTLQSAA
jgi:hypothetical protein